MNWNYPHGVFLLLAFVGNTVYSEKVVDGETPLPVMKETGCYNNLDEIFEISEDDRLLEETKKFVLCPHTTYEVGQYRCSGESDDMTCGIMNGQKPLVPRSNTIIQCGEDGLVSNGCIIKGGDWGLITVPLLYEHDYETSNVLIKGITFEANELFSIFFGLPGKNVVVDDCIVRNDFNQGPIVLNNIGPWNFRRSRKLTLTEGGKDYSQYQNRWERVHNYMIDMKNGDFDQEVENNSQNLRSRGLKLKAGTTKDIDPLYITFQNMIIENNKQGTEGMNIENGLITLRNKNHVATFKHNYIAGNNYSDSNFASVGYALSNAGSEVNLVDNCFADNNFFGPGMVLMKSTSKFTSNGNQVTYTADNTRSTFDNCEFIVSYETEESNDYKCDNLINNQDETNICEILNARLQTVEMKKNV